MCTVIWFLLIFSNLDVQSAIAPPGLSLSLVARVTGGNSLEADQLEKVDKWISSTTIIITCDLYMYMIIQGLA